MSLQPSWLEQVPGILQQLEAADSLPFLDRPAIERLFSLRRRQAIRLMAMCGGYQVGKTCLVNRTQLIAYLHNIIATGSVDRAARRKQRVHEVLGQARQELAARKVPIEVQSQIYDHRLTSLPDGVLLKPGKLTIAFQDPVELLQRLFALSQALANDFEQLERYCGGNIMPL